MAYCKQASLALDSDVAGRADALNLAELLLAAVGACILKNIERVAPILGFKLRAVHIEVHGERQDAPPKRQRISYHILVDTDEADHRLALLHRNVRQYGTVFDAVAGRTVLEGYLERHAPSSGPGWG